MALIDCIFMSLQQLFNNFVIVHLGAINLGKKESCKNSPAHPKGTSCGRLRVVRSFGTLSYSSLCEKSKTGEDEVLVNFYSRPGTVATDVIIDISHKIPVNYSLPLISGDII